MQGKGGFRTFALASHGPQNWIGATLGNPVENLLQHLPGAEVTLGFMAHSFYNI